MFLMLLLILHGVDVRLEGGPDPFCFDLVCLRLSSGIAARFWVVCPLLMQGQQLKGRRQEATSCSEQREKARLGRTRQCDIVTHFVISRLWYFR